MSKARARISALPIVGLRKQLAELVAYVGHTYGVDDFGIHTDLRALPLELKGSASDDAFLCVDARGLLHGLRRIDAEPPPVVPFERIGVLRLVSGVSNEELIGALRAAIERAEEHATTKILQRRTFEQAIPRSA